MMIARFCRTLAWTSFAGVILGIPVQSGAQTADPNHKIVEGIEIYLGVLPAEAVRGRPMASAENAMHHGIPSGAGYYHLNAALMDRTTKASIADAQVKARVEGLGMGSESKPMEPMEINHAVTYGNYFRLAGKGPYWITVEIRRPDARMVSTKFEYKRY